MGPVVDRDYMETMMLRLLGGLTVGLCFYNGRMRG